MSLFTIRVILTFVVFEQSRLFCRNLYLILKTMMDWLY